MKIARVDLLPFSIPLVRPLETARGRIGARSGWIVRLETPAGVVGLGEAAPHPHAAPEEVATEAVQLETTSVRVRQRDRAGFDALLGCLREAPRWIACGFDTALWDLRARVEGAPLPDLLGAHRTILPVNGLLEAHELDACIEEARDLVRRGFTHAKRKVSRDLDRTRREVAALAEAVQELKIRLDVNGTWSAAEAPSACAALAMPNVEWIEQPVGPGEEKVGARLRAEGGVRIAFDESVRGVEEAGRLVRDGACDALVVKLVQVGGISEAVRIVEAAARTETPVAITSGFDTGVGLAAAAAVAAAAPGPLAACGLATGPLLAGDVVSEPFPSAPTVQVGRGPGLGVTLDESSLAAVSAGQGAP